jgi:3-isopropylmalate dehydrogenase
MLAANLSSTSWRQIIRDGEGDGAAGEALVGVLPGEGVGAEVTDAALEVLRQLERAGGGSVAIERGGPIGLVAKRNQGVALPEEAVAFCTDVLARGGGILNGPGGGRYVYDLRRRLGLFLKISPIQAHNGLLDRSPLRQQPRAGVDMLIVRENLGGVYQGRSRELSDSSGGREARHELSYSERDVQRFLLAAARLARSRRRQLTVVVKDAGMEAFSVLWRECAEQAARECDVSCSIVDVDLMAYRLLERPGAFDVIAASNLFGDVLSDLAAILLGSRALSFGGSFTVRGGGVYQTNHGSAHDIAGTDRANPVGQILSLAMLLRESLGMEREALACEAGVRRVWAEGHRTADLVASGEPFVGTAEMAALVGQAAATELTGALDRA